MLSLGAVTFTFPWVLTSLAILPLIWLLLRITPPSAQLISFPAIRLLFGLMSSERSAARTPWWLMIIRLACIALIIVAFADPVINLRQAMRQSPLVIIVDDGWAAAREWSARQVALMRLLEGAMRDKRPVMLATSAKPGPGADQALSFMPAADVITLARNIEAKPWRSDRKGLLTKLRNTDLRPPIESVWLTDGVATDSDEELASLLQRLGRLSVLTRDSRTGPYVLGPANRLLENNENIIEVTLRRPANLSADPAVKVIVALDQTSQILARAEANFEPGISTSSARFNVPTELGNRMVQLSFENDSGAAGVYLLDSRWTQRPVGVVSDNPDGIITPLLEDGFYATQALLPYAEVRTGTVADLLTRELALIIMASGSRVADLDVAALEPWLERGGVLVRFSGSTMNGNIDTLLPVRLRGGGRTFGGTMSWTEPAGLAPFPQSSPFAGLQTPDDVLVSTQVLAEPTPGLKQRTWARLEDGTPLVTAERRGDGWVILFHVTATPEWSSLPLSGVMVEMLRRILDLSRGVEEASSTLPQSLPAREVLNGAGQLITPPPTVLSINRDEVADPDIGPVRPPGYYGIANTRVAINLGPTIGPFEAQTSWPNGVTVSSIDSIASERTLKPWLLFAALLLFVSDFVISLILRGLTPMSATTRTATAAGLLIFCVVTKTETAWGQDNNINPATIEAVLQTRLAYVRTGRSSIDQLSGQGLRTLTKVLAARTSAEMAAPAEIDPETDDLLPYPVVYWRIAPDQNPPSEKAARRINHYLSRGGMMIFDAPSQVGANKGGEGQQVGEALNKILTRLNVPPLVQVPENHVLLRSFYLLPALPGRYKGAPVYIERGSINNDGVSSIIIGSHDWAAAWARDKRGLPMFPVVPGGERQREWSYRFGVNMVMYALTGNYKTDQVHLPAIMERLTQ